jgi:hypothetical protein
MNLDVALDNQIIVIADLGRWNGRFSGYKMIVSGNIKDCLYDNHNDYIEWYVDDEGEFRSHGDDHDGTSYYLYRVFKDDVGEEDIEELQGLIYEDKATQEDIDKYTDKIGDVIAKVYGWKVAAA